jgi:acyl-CoA reductase-like NAD-dependent aldehyde dehydrogenase
VAQAKTLEEKPWSRNTSSESRLDRARPRRGRAQFCSGDGELLPITAGDRIDAIRSTSSRAILEVSETTANDIEQAGQAAVEIAAELLKEAQELAAQLRETGNKMGAYLQEFATLARKVSTAMRNTRAEVLNSEDPLPSAAMLPGMPDKEFMH